MRVGHARVAGILVDADMFDRTSGRWETGKGLLRVEILQRDLARRRLPQHEGAHSAVQHGVGSGHNSVGSGGRDSLTRDRPRVVDPDAELSTSGRRHWPIRRRTVASDG